MTCSMADSRTFVVDAPTADVLTGSQARFIDWYTGHEGRFDALSVSRFTGFDR